MTPSIPFHIPHTPLRAEDYVLQAMRSGQHVNGDFTRRCATLLKERYGPVEVLVTHSATAALEMSSMLLAEAAGASAVYMPSYTFSSTANAYLRAGYDLTFVDVNPSTMAAGLAEFQEADPPPGSVIVPVHYVGDPGETDLITAWAAEGNLLIAEDAAQALGSRLGDTEAGTFGAVGAISFHYTKNVHASLGGALYINDPSLVETATYIWERGTNRQAFLRGSVDKYTWVQLGSSFQGTEMQAALLLAGLKEFDEITKTRRVVWEAYADRLAGLEDRGLYAPPLPRGVTNYHGFFIRLELPEWADALREHLAEQGILLHSHYVPLHNSPLGKRLGLDRPLPNTERWAACLLRLPLHTGMGPDDAHQVADGVLGWLEKHQSSN